MKKNIFISGKQCTGKTTKAKEITEGKQSIWLTDFHEADLRYHLAENTEVIVIDEISNTLELQAIKKLSEIHTIFFRTPYHKEISQISTPQIIAISNSISKEEAFKVLSESFEYIEL